MIPRKKNRRRKSIGVTAAAIKTTAGMTTTDRRTGVAASKGLAENIGSTGSNDVTVKSPTMIDTQSRVRTNHNHLGITDVQNKTKRSQRSTGNDTRRLLHQRRNPASIASCANNPDTTLRNNHVASKGLTENIGSTGSNDVTTKAPTMIDTRSRGRTNPNHLVITDVRNKTKRS